MLSMGILTFREGDAHGDECAVAWSAADPHLAAPGAGAFAHADQSERSRVEDLALFYPPAVVADLQGNAEGRSSEADADPGRSRVTNDVRQRLLADAEDRCGAVSVQDH